MPTVLLTVCSLFTYFDCCHLLVVVAACLHLSLLPTLLISPLCDPASVSTSPLRGRGPSLEASFRCRTATFPYPIEPVNFPSSQPIQEPDLLFFIQTTQSRPPPQQCPVSASHLSSNSESNMPSVPLLLAYHAQPLKPACGSPMSR